MIEKIKRNAIEKILSIQEDSDDGALVLFKCGDEVSGHIINLTQEELASILYSLENQMEVE